MASSELLLSSSSPLMISVDHRCWLWLPRRLSGRSRHGENRPENTTHVINTGSKDNDDNGNLILVDKNKIYMVTYIDISTIFRGEGTIFAEGLVEKSNWKYLKFNFGRLNLLWINFFHFWYFLEIEFIIMPANAQYIVWY